MKSTRLTRLFWLVVLLTLSISCSIGPAATPTQAPIVVQPTEPPPPTAIPPTDVPPTAVPPTDTPIPTITPTQGPIIIDDDFSADAGRFKCDACVISDGSLTMGPFPVTNSIEFFYTVCEDCGIATNYKMSVDTWFQDGNSSYGFGLLLRDSDSTQYYLAVSTWLVYNVFSMDATGWNSLMGRWREGPLKGGKSVNRAEVLVKDSQVTITINGDMLRVVDLPKGSGGVGLFVGAFDTVTNFDNFHYEELP